MDAELEAPADPASMTFAEQSLSWSRSLLLLSIEAPSSVDLQSSPSRLSSSSAFCSRTSPAHPCARGQGTPRVPRSLPTSPALSASTTAVDRSHYLAPPCRRPATFVTRDRQIRSRWVGSSRPCLAAGHQRPSVSRVFWINKDETPRTVPGPSSTFSKDFAKYHDMNDP